MTADFELDTNDYLPLREVVYQTLRKAILKEKLKPGERLMENTIATKLGVSRTPVREAIRMLSDEGLVLLLPRRGAQVAQISRQELNDVLEIRRSLESLATVKACGRISREELKELREAEAHFAELLPKGDLTAIAEADEAFHDVIYRAAGNARLLGIVSNLREQMYRCRLEYLKQPGVSEKMTAEHSAILEAMAAGDTARAEALIAEHIDSQKTAIDSLLQEDTV